MQQVITSECGFNQFSGFNPVMGTMREITYSEIEQVSGGIAPLLVAGAKFAAGAFVVGFCSRAGSWAFDEIFGDPSSR